MWMIDKPEPALEPSEEPQEVEVILRDLSKVLKIGLALSTTKKTKITNSLIENQDVFTWKHEDMPRIDREVIQHRLKVNPECKPVKQRRRIFTPKCNKLVVEEVEKLLEASFIREVFYPEWLANVVMVKKNNDKWRMCVDFTDLNKACLKDSFSLPRIHQLVNLTVGPKLLNFMDAFSDYNQIMMDEEYQEKIAFAISQGLYCYKVMPFKLKNGWATYQRLVNCMFSHQIGRIVEVYVDDMLVKSNDEVDHQDNLR